jgi:drug/metabolite transporter (DMT)-like permease
VSNTRRVEIAGFAIAALAAILFSAKAILAKLLYRYQIDPITLMTLRLGMAMPVFLAVAAIESWRARERGDHLNGREWRQILLLGFLGYYVSSYLDFWGLQHIAAALERLILFLTPTLVLALGVLLYRRSVPRRQRWALLISYAGVVLVFIEHLRFDGGDVVFGSMLVFGAALSYALYLLQSGELVARVGSLVSTALCLIHFATVHGLQTLRQPMPVLQLSLLNALMCTVAPVFLTMFAIARIGAGRSSQLSMLGPVSLLFLGHWILGERISLIQIIGTGIVLIGIAILTGGRRA